jgi:hypothetical protein
MGATIAGILKKVKPMEIYTLGEWNERGLSQVLQCDQGSCARARAFHVTKPVKDMGFYHTLPHMPAEGALYMAWHMEYDDDEIIGHYVVPVMKLCKKVGKKKAAKGKEHVNEAWWKGYLGIDMTEGSGVHILPMGDDGKLVAPGKIKAAYTYIKCDSSHTEGVCMMMKVVPIKNGSSFLIPMYDKFAVPFQVAMKTGCKGIMLPHKSMTRLNTAKTDQVLSTVVDKSRQLTTGSEFYVTEDEDEAQDETGLGSSGAIDLCHMQETRDTQQQDDEHQVGDKRQRQDQGKDSNKRVRFSVIVD